MVERITIGFNGDRGFVLIHQKFDKNIVRVLFTEEYPLNITSHRNEPINGKLLVQVLHIVSPMNRFLKPHNKGEGQNHTIMAEAEPYTWFSRGYC